MAEANLELVAILLPYPLEFQNFRCEPACPVYLIKSKGRLLFFKERRFYFRKKKFKSLSPLFSD